MSVIGRNWPQNQQMCKILFVVDFCGKVFFYVDSYKNDSRCFGSSLHYAVYQGNEEFVKWVISFMMIIVIKMIMLMIVILLSRWSSLLFQTDLVEGRRCELDIRARLHSTAHGRSTSSSIVILWHSIMIITLFSMIMVIYHDSLKKKKTLNCPGCDQWAWCIGADPYQGHRCHKYLDCNLLLLFQVKYFRVGLTSTLLMRKA